MIVLLLIVCQVSLIYGLPAQTLASFRASIDFCRAASAPVIRAFPLMLLRGTPLYDLKAKHGLLESTDFGIDISALIQLEHVFMQSFKLDFPLVISSDHVPNCHILVVFLFLCMLVLFFLNQFFVTVTELTLLLILAAILLACR